MSRPAEAESQSQKRPQTVGHSSGSEQLQASGDRTPHAPSLRPETEYSTSFSRGSFDNSGAGTQTNNIGGVQNTNWGSGTQISGGHFSAPVNFHQNSGSQKDEKQCLADLRSTDPRDHKKRIEHTKGHLLRDSYKWVLDNAEFQKWRDEEDTRLLWIRGDPGKGKTMLLCGIIDELSPLKKSTDQEPGALLSYFFCEATNAPINNATSVLRGLIYLLVDKVPSLISHIRKKHDHAGKALFEDSNAWFAVSDIFTNILQDLRLRSTYLIIDALDECVPEDLPKLLDFIVQNSSSSHVKWIISSRNDPEIERKLKLDRSSARLCLNLEKNDKHVSQAIDAYIHRRVSRLSSIQGDGDSQAKVRDVMRRKANGTFLWVSLVFKELEAAKCWEVGSIIDEIPDSLKEVYSRMIKRIQHLKRGLPELCRLLLSTVTIAYRPLRLEELGTLSGVPKYISDQPQSIAVVVSLCGSFLTVRDGIVYIIHQTAKEFLLEDASRDIFTSGVGYVHHHIVMSSLRVMGSTIRRDMYGLRHPGCPIDRFEKPSPDPLSEVRYSCVYWVDHLHEAEQRREQTKNLELPDQLQDHSTAHGFLSTKFIYWLETLSLSRSMLSGVLAITKLEQLLSTRSSKNSDFLALVHDAGRFILYFRFIIEGYPLQVYSSALVFSPTQSPIRQLFRYEEPEWITEKPKMESQWNALVQTLEGHTSSINSVTFSSDCQRLLSASDDRTVLLWDANTGALLRTFEGNTGRVLSVAFSSDCQQLASASDDGTVLLWNANTGILLRTFEGNTGRVLSVTFSSDCERLMSASNDGIVITWDISTGVLLRTLGGNMGTVSSVAFSSDGECLAFVSSNTEARLGHESTVKVWHIDARRLLFTTERYKGQIWSVALSPDGKSLASASHDAAARPRNKNTVKILGLNRGMREHTFGEFSDRVWSVAFSPDSKELASGCSQGLIQLRDASNGAVLRTLKGNAQHVNSVAFSPDGKRLASASYDGTVRLWDVNTGLLSPTLSHTGRVHSVVFSIEGRQLASTSYDGTVRLWHTGTGELHRTLQGLVGRTNSVAFSPDGKQLATGSSNGIVRLWDTSTGELLRTLKVATNYDKSATSTDKSQLELRSQGTVMHPLAASTKLRRPLNMMTSALRPRNAITDALQGLTLNTGMLQNLSGHPSRVDCVAFSPNGQQLASTLYDGTIRLWNIGTGVLQHTFEGHMGQVNSVAFTPDYDYLASGSDDSKVLIWDVRTGALLRTLEGNMGRVLSVAFSPDCRRLLSGSHDGTVWYWEVATGALLQTYSTAPTSRLSFNDHSKVLTDRGTIVLAGVSNQSDEHLETTESLDHYKRPKCIGWGFSDDSHWVTWNGQRVLWLPPEYRPVRLGVVKEKVAIGCLSGQVLILGFAAGKLVV